MTTLPIIIHILSPAAVFTCYFASSLWETVSTKEEATVPEAVDPSASSSRQTAPAPERDTHLTRPQILQRGVQILLSTLVGLLYASEAIALSCSPTPTRQSGTADEGVVFALFSSLIWLILLLSLFDVGAAPTGRNFYTAWSVAAAFEVILLCVGFMTSNEYSSHVRIVQVISQSTRLVTELVLIASERLNHLNYEPSFDEEIAPLLAGDSTKTDRETDTDAVDFDTRDDSDLQRISKNWWLYVRGFKLFLPIIRPKTIRQYLCIFGVCVCIAIERVLKVAVPVTLGAIVSALSLDKAHIVMPWIPISIYTGLMILESSAGVGLARDLLWQPFEQGAMQRMKRASYDKLMSLSCDFHDSKKSDVTFQTVQRGSRITDLVETVCFELLPMAADLVISVSVFWYIFDGYVGFVVGVVVVLYIWSILKSVSVRSALWREFIEVWEKEWYSMTESVKNWDAVSHFGRIPYEMNNFKERTHDTRHMQLRWMILSKITGSSRSLILIGGLAAGACIVAHQVVVGGHDVGKFIVFTAYWAQLSAPLHFFARGFNSISKGLVDAEKLLTLFEKQPTVQNAEEAVPFFFKGGAVDFKNVSFSYDGKRTVTNKVTLHAEPGKIIAFVGETGCGKSTLFKLLFRFYDPMEGSIYIDGQDIKDLILDGFRNHLGIVPQEPVLFNKSIRENLRYPDLEATDEQIENACKAVSLHDKITSFTKGYNEVIGERGTKLSGGERQRVAIARAILKNPSILLLDEATSSVDSTTEAQIQASLKALCANRTTFVIAHRLSTIVNADQVIVMDDGKIVESGTHASLIKQSGPYRKLWTSQLSGHINELRGRSKSRSKCCKDKHLLENDLNSSDEEVKKLLAETVELEGYTITADQVKTTKEASAHEVSHDNHSSHGRNTARSPNVGSHSAFVSKSPVRPPLQTRSSTASNFHSSHVFGVVSQSLSVNLEKRNYSAINPPDLEKATGNMDDDDYVKKMHSINPAATAAVSEVCSKGNKLMRNQNGNYSIPSAQLEAPKVSPVSTDPTTVETKQKNSDERLLHVESDQEDSSEHIHDDNFRTPHSPAEASRRRKQSVSEPVHQNPTQNDGARDDKLLVSAYVNTKRRAIGRLGPGRRTFSSSARPSPMPQVGTGLSEGLQINDTYAGSNRESRFEDQAMNGSAAPVLKVPTNSPAGGQTPSPGALSEASGGVGLGSSPENT